MKNKKIRILFFSLAMLFALVSNVYATTIVETTEDDEYGTIESNTIIIGITKFESSEILTAGKVTEATYNYMKLNSDNPYVEIPSIFYYLEDRWYEIDDENNITLVEDTSVLEKLDIYFVNNEEKMLEIPVKYVDRDGYNLIFKSNDSTKDSRIKYENEVIYVPASLNEVKVFSKNIETSEENEIEIWRKKKRNSTEFISSISDDSMSLEKLQSTYEFTYYATLVEALNDMNNSKNNGSSIANGEAGIYKDENNNLNLVLLKDTTVNQTIEFNLDSNFNLGGKTLTSTAYPIINVNSNVNIVASIEGSKIEGNGTPGEKTTIVNVESGECTILGGTYSSTTLDAGTKTNQASVMIVESNGTLEVKDAKIYSKDNGNGSVVGIYSKAGSKIEIIDTAINVEASGESLENCAVYSLGDATFTNCNIVAKADYTGNAAGTDYESNSRGIYCEGNLELNDCYVWGAHSGVTVMGNVLVNGGTYEGYGHGAFYLRSANTNSYFYDATFNWAPMKEGTVSDTIAGTNGAGFYVGGASNINAYFDNCKFNTIGGSEYIYKGEEVPFYAIVLRSSGGESNNSIYLSNCEFLNATRYAYRIGNHNWASAATLKVYNGIGNDYSSVNTIYNYPERYIETNDSYTK